MYEIKQKHYNKAAFELHQAVERFYTTILRIDYKPKTHDLEELGINVDRLSAKFKEIFPKKSEEGKTPFRTIAAPMSKPVTTCPIKLQEENRMSRRIKKLQSATGKVCKEKIESFII